MKRPGGGAWIGIDPAVVVVVDGAGIVTAVWAVRVVRSLVVVGGEERVVVVDGLVRDGTVLVVVVGDAAVVVAGMLDQRRRRRSWMPRWRIISPRWAAGVQVVLRMPRLRRLLRQLVRLRPKGVVMRMWIW
jgi:hypothetical protein